MAAPNREVRIREHVKITPFTESATASVLPLTYFDTFWLKFSPVERLFFYQLNDLTSDLFHSAMLPRLKDSLSLTLLHYLPIAGSIMRPGHATKPAIYYSPNDGVSFTVAESNADFNFLSGDGIHEAAEFNPLVPQLATSDDKADAMAIQITLFPNEGFTIGISCHHAVLDGKSSTMFMKSWAYLCKQFGKEENPFLLPELTPSFDRTVIRDPKGLDMVFVNHWLAFMGSADSPSLKLLPSMKPTSNLVRATFQLTREDIKKLRDKVVSIIDKVDENEERQFKELHLSTFVIACSYAYVCLVKAKGGDDNNRRVHFGIAADYRSRLDPPVPSNYVGNCVGGHFVVAKAIDLLEENGVAFVAEKLSDGIKKMEKGVDAEVSEEKFVRMLTVIKEGAQVLSVAGSTRFDVYRSDFGWGRPKKVEIVSIDRTGAVSVAESKDDGGGVEVGLVLEKQQMEVFASLFADGLN